MNSHSQPSFGRSAWTIRENVRAQLRLLVKRILRKCGYPPDKQEKATQTVLEQAELLSAKWAAAYGKFSQDFVAALLEREVRFADSAPHEFLMCWARAHQLTIKEKSFIL